MPFDFSPLLEYLNFATMEDGLDVLDRNKVILIAMIDKVGPFFNA
jgi:hypothetical protein